MHIKSGSRSEQGFNSFSSPELLSRGTTEPEDGRVGPYSPVKGCALLSSCQLPISHPFNKDTVVAMLPTFWPGLQEAQALLALQPSFLSSAQGLPDGNSWAPS